MKKLTHGISLLPLTASLLALCTSGMAQTPLPIPGDARSAGLYYIVPDTAIWYDTVGLYPTNGFINLSTAELVSDLGNWEPYASSMGENTFLIEFNTYANDGTYANQNYAVCIQPTDGRKGKVVYAYYGDNGTPFPGMIDLSRENGNPGRVAGDRRVGATNYITECEVSIGQISQFQTAQSGARWTTNSNNNIYQSTDRYAAEQVFGYNPATMAVTPLTLAWDYVYGPVNLAMGPDNNAPECSRTGGRPDFLDNGNIVVMIDDKTGIADAVNGEVVTFAIITPTGQQVTGYTEADTESIFDNMCPVKGGFCIRADSHFYFYNDSGVLQFSNNMSVAVANMVAAPPAGLGLTGASFDTGRGDADHVAGDPRIPYVFYADAVSWTGGSNGVVLSVWDSRTGNFVTNFMVNPDLDHSRFSGDRTALGVNMNTQIVVACDAELDKTTGSGYADQVIAQVLSFDGQNIHYLTPSFFAFINSDNTNTISSFTLTPQGFTTIDPGVAVTTNGFCISAKGLINSTNNPSEQVVGITQIDSPSPDQDLYAVISLPIGGPATANSSYIQKDVALWWNATKNQVASGFINAAQQANPAQLGDWEPYMSQVGDAAFLVEFNMFANDGSLANQNYYVAVQPAAGGAPNVIAAFETDKGNSGGAVPFLGEIDLSRENGNPGRVAGDMRPGATTIMTECETSIGQLGPFQVDGNRWAANPIYQGTDRYCAEQLFTLNPSTWAATAVTDAWDYVYGPYTAADLGTGNNAPQCSRTGGRPTFLDNGNIAVVIDDKTAILSTSGEVATYSVVTPEGTVVAGPTVVNPTGETGLDIWDNVCSFKGGFAIRVHNLIHLYNDAGVELTNFDVVETTGLPWGGGADAGGRGDGYRIAGNFNSPYIMMAGGTTNVSGGYGNSDSGVLYVAAWDTRIINSAANNVVAMAQPCPLDPHYYALDRTMIAMDENNNFTVVFAMTPDTFHFVFNASNTGASQLQTAARVGHVSSSGISWVGPMFWPFVNTDVYGNSFPSNTIVANTVPFYQTMDPAVAMTPQAICISAKGTINSTNNAAAAPDSGNQTDVYVVIANPAFSAIVPPPTISKVTLGGTPAAPTLTLSWSSAAGNNVTLLSSANAKTPLASWTTVSPQPAITGPVSGQYSMTFNISTTGDTFYDLVSP